MTAWSSVRNDRVVERKAALGREGLKALEVHVVHLTTHAGLAHDAVDDVDRGLGGRLLALSLVGPGHLDPKGPGHRHGRGRNRSRP